MNRSVGAGSAALASLCSVGAGSADATGQMVTGFTFGQRVAMSCALSYAPARGQRTRSAGQTTSGTGSHIASA
jgi:hypothetical protein